MSDIARKVTELAQEAINRAPVGMRAFHAILAAEEKAENEKGRAYSTLCADFSPHKSSNGNLKVSDWVRSMEYTGEYDSLRRLLAHFGMLPTPMYAVTPDAPTLDAEMLQDYPAMVGFHQAVQDFRAGTGAIEAVLSAYEGVVVELRQDIAKMIGQKSTPEVREVVRQ